MAKRFIDTGLFRKPSLRAMKAPYKALFVYLMCECDHAGIWDVELDVAEMRLGLKLDPEKALGELGGAVVPIEDGKKWWLVEFCDFQYGEMNPANRVHASVIARLQSFGLDLGNKPLTSPLQGAKDKDKEKDKDLDKDKEQDKEKDARAEIWPTFNDWWDAYGKKIDRPKCEAKWERMTQQERETAYRHTEAYVLNTPNIKYRRNPTTYLNNQNWNDEQLTVRPEKQPHELTYEERIAEGLRIVADYNASHDGSGGKWPR